MQEKRHRRREAAFVDTSRFDAVKLYKTNAIRRSYL